MIKGLDTYIEKQASEKMVLLAVRVPSKLLEDLKKIAKTSELKYTDIVRAAIDKIVVENASLKKKTVTGHKRTPVQMPMFDDFL